MPRKFTFRLQKVLQMREQKEKLLQARFAELQAQARLERIRLQELQEAQEAARQELIRFQRGTVDINEVMNYLNYLDRLASDIVRQEQVVREAEERAEEARLDLIRASQEKKAVEKLKEKQHEDYLKEQQHAEIVFLDEVSSARFNRNQAGTGGTRGHRTAPGGEGGA